MNLRRAIGPALAVVLLAGVGFAIRRSIQDRQAAEASSRLVSTRITVKILTGSEKEKFLSDPELAKILDARGYRHHGSKSRFARNRDTRRTSRPSMSPTRQAHTPLSKIAQITGSKRSYTSFYTPMAIASWKSLIPVLEQSGLVTHKDGTFYLSDMGKLVAMMQKGTRWKDLPGNTAYAVGKSVLISSTDVRKSNSGGMYLSLAAYVANGNNVVDNEADAERSPPAWSGCSHARVFRNPVPLGRLKIIRPWASAKRRMVMIYEQQFLEYVLVAPESESRHGPALPGRRPFFRNTPSWRSPTTARALRKS